MGRFFGVLLLAVAEVASAGWARFYGDNVQLQDLRLTGDGEIIVLGSLDDNDDGEFNDELCLNWVAKLNRAGEILWQKCHGGGFTYSVLPMRDGGVLVLGELEDPERGRILKLEASGAVQWDKSYFVPAAENASVRAAAETDTGYIAIGDIEPESGPNKAWILGLDRDGNRLWQKTLSGFMATAIRPTRDGNLVVAGATGLTGKAEAWVMKLAANGQSLWQRVFYSDLEEIPGGSHDLPFVSSIQETQTGEYWVAGVTLDALPDPEGESFPEFRSRAWIAKLDREGHMVWRKVYGEEVPEATMVQALSSPDGGLFALGAYKDLKQERLGLRVWLAKLNAVGEIEWQRFYGEDSGGEAFLQLQPDGRPLLAGASFLGTRGDWLLNLEADGSLPGCTFEAPASLAFREAKLSERTIAYDETPPAVTVQSEETKAEDRHVVSLPACPVADAFRSCKQIQEAGKSYGDGVYPIALQTPQGFKLLGARCAMKEFGGGWLWIARHSLSDPKPPADFVNVRFGEYGSFSSSFSLWPQVDWSATDGVVGLSWWEGSEFKAGLLGEMTSEELQRILATSPSVDAWVR